MKTILMTGAAGRIGTFLRPELAGKYKLRLSDIKPIRDLRPGETFVRADISKLSDMLRVTKGVDAVVLGADLNLVTGGAPLDTLLQPLDRRQGALAATAPKHVSGSQDWTWRDVHSPFPPSRLDYVLYSARTLVVRRAFVLETEDLHADLRGRLGLEAGSSQRLSDHRPVIADFAWAP